MSYKNIPQTNIASGAQSTTLASAWTQTTTDTFEETGLELTFSVQDGDRLMLGFYGSVYSSTSSLLTQQAFELDGVRLAPFAYTASTAMSRAGVSGFYITDPLTAGEHTVKLVQAKITGSGNLTIQIDGIVLQGIRIPA